MSPAGVTPAQISAQKMRTAQELLINGVITAEEFELISQLHGPRRKRTLRGWVVKAAPWAGYALTAATALAQIVAHFRPELRGPLDSIIDALGVVVTQ